jgi:hypothetical protein
VVDRRGAAEEHLHTGARVVGERIGVHRPRDHVGHRHAVLGEPVAITRNTDVSS